MDRNRINEECRIEVLGYLAARPGISQTAGTIHRRLARENDFTPGLVEAALSFLAGMNPPLVEAEISGLGSTRYYKATSDGILAFERGI